jgi:hypothetical protein
VLYRRPKTAAAINDAIVVATFHFQIFMLPAFNTQDSTVNTSNLRINDTSSPAGRKTYLDLPHHYNDDPHRYVPFLFAPSSVERSQPATAKTCGSVVMGGMQFMCSLGPTSAVFPAKARSRLVPQFIHSSFHDSPNSRCPRPPAQWQQALRALHGRETP